MTEHTIGTATMENDGTLVLVLRADSNSGTKGDARFIYTKSDPNYLKILQHIGKILPGETKPVRPWE